MHTLKSVNSGYKSKLKVDNHSTSAKVKLPADLPVSYWACMPYLLFQRHRLTLIISTIRETNKPEAKHFTFIVFESNFI